MKVYGVLLAIAGVLFGLHAAGLGWLVGTVAGVVVGVEVLGVVWMVLEDMTGQARTTRARRRLGLSTPRRLDRNREEVPR